MKLYKRGNKKVSEDAPEREKAPVVSEKHTRPFVWGREGD
jgi:hypothetical protein